MNKDWQNSSIEVFLRRSFLYSAGMVFLLGVIAFFLNKTLVNKRIIEITLASHAKIVAVNSTAVLLFRDEKNAEEILRSVESIPGIDEGYLFLKNGETLAHYLAPNQASATFVNGLPPHGLTWTTSHLWLHEPIEHQKSHIGTIFLRFNYTTIMKSTLWDAALMGFFLLFLGILSFLLFSRAQKTVSQPLIQLAMAMENISATANYSLRVEEIGTGETVYLAQRFNEMLERIEAREKEIQEHKSLLEEKVRERTIQLQDVNQQLEGELQQRRETEMELRKQTENLALASEALRKALDAEKRFLASVSHEIRTPLNYIFGVIQVLCQSQLDPAHALLVTNAYRSSQMLMSLINNVLDVSKIDAGQVEFEREKLNLREILLECLDLAAFNLDPRVVVQQEIPVFPGLFLGDPLRIRQIFLNLLTNAVKFTPKGTIQLKFIESVPAGPTQTRLTFLVEDTGIGIPTDKICKIGTPFLQAHGSRHGGTGLGLYLVGNIARLMGGDLRIESAAGAGTRVFVSFCLELLQNSASPAESTTALSPKDFHDLKILLVEDELLNAAIARQIFQTFFEIPQIEVAGSGAEALEKVKAGHFDLIFMDIQLPDMDGIAVTQKIRETDRETPIAALSAHAFKSEVERAMAAGMNDYVPKPLEKDRIWETFKKLCRPRRRENMSEEQG
jgi:signal transduction histidine kinase/CheY-like chemotaxis protein